MSQTCRKKTSESFQSNFCFQVFDKYSLYCYCDVCNLAPMVSFTADVDAQFFLPQCPCLPRCWTFVSETRLFHSEMVFRGCSTRILWPVVWALQWMPGPRGKLATSIMFWFQTFAYHLHLLCGWHFLCRVVFSCRCVYDTFSTFCMQPSTANALGSSGNQASTKSVGINLYNQKTFFWHEKCSHFFGTETIQICHYDSVPAPLKASLDTGKFGSGHDTMHG